MKRFLIALSVFFLIILLAFILFKPFSFTTISSSPVINEEKLWSLIQDWRVKNNLEPYIEDQRLCDIAKKRAPEIQNEIDSSTTHSGFLTKFKNYPYKISENVIAYAKDESDALNWWLSSSSHRKALEYSWSYSCVKCFNNFCSQIFSSFEP